MMNTDDLTAIHAVRHALESAENAGDAEAAVALLADDAVVMVPDFPVHEGKDACAAFLRDMMPALHAEFDRHVTYSSDEVLIAGNVVIDRGTFSFSVSPRSGGDPEQVTGKYLWILKRSAANQWRIARLIIARDERAWEET